MPKRLHHAADIVSERDVLKMATVNGYRSQGRGDSGVIKPGFNADLCVVDTDRVNMYPHNDIVNNLVYAANGSDVALTMVDGKVLYRDGEYTTLDIEKLKYEVQASSERIIAEVNKK